MHRFTRHLILDGFVNSGSVGGIDSSSSDHIIAIIHDIAELTNLETLRLHRHSASPLGNNVLNAIFTNLGTKLQILEIDGVVGNPYQVVDVSQVSELKCLRALTVSSCDASIDMTSISSLTQLEKLSLSHCRNLVGGFEAISSMAHLLHLDLMSTRIADALPLSHLTKLVFLRLRNTRIHDIVSALSTLNDLEHLDISALSVNDVSPLLSLTRLRNLFLCNPEYVRGVHALRRRSLETRGVLIIMDPDRTINRILGGCNQS